MGHWCFRAVPAVLPVDRAVSQAVHLRAVRAGPVEWVAWAAVWNSIRSSASTIRVSRSAARYSPFPALKAKYLANMRTIAEDSLDWKKLGPVVADFRKLIEKEVEADTRKLDSFETFKRNTDDSGTASGAPMGRGFGQGMNLRAFAEQRQKYLLNHPQVKKPQ